MEKIHAPSEEEIAKASSNDILKKLIDVKQQDYVIDTYSKTAKELILQHQGDSEKALCVALAYCSKQNISNKENVATNNRGLKKDRGGYNEPGFGGGKSFGFNSHRRQERDFGGYNDGGYKGANHQ